MNLHLWVRHAAARSRFTSERLPYEAKGVIGLEAAMPACERVIESVVRTATAGRTGAVVLAEVLIIDAGAGLFRTFWIGCGRVEATLTWLAGAVTTVRTTGREAVIVTGIEVVMNIGNQALVISALLIGMISQVSLAQPPEAPTKDSLIREIASEISRLAPQAARNRFDGAPITALSEKAYPDFDLLAETMETAPSFTRTDAMILVRFTHDITGIDPGSSAAEITYPLRGTPAFAAILAECSGRSGNLAQRIANQESLTQLGLPPLTRAEVCDVKSMFDSIARLESQGNG